MSKSVFLAAMLENGENQRENTWRTVNIELCSTINVKNVKTFYCEFYVILARTLQRFVDYFKKVVVRSKINGNWRLPREILYCIWAKRSLSVVWRRAGNVWTRTYSGSVWFQVQIWVFSSLKKKKKSPDIFRREISSLEKGIQFHSRFRVLQFFGELSWK